MLEVCRPRDVRSVFVFDDLGEDEPLRIEGGFWRATAVPSYKKVVGKAVHYVGTGGNEIVTTTSSDEVLVPLFEYTELSIEGFSLSVATMLDQRLRALIESVTLGREDEAPCVESNDVEGTLREAFQGKPGQTLHLLKDLPILRWGFAFAVLDYAGVLVKRGQEYGMFVEAERVAFVRTSQA